jgi:hypothetical protein
LGPQDVAFSLRSTSRSGGPLTPYCGRYLNADLIGSVGNGLRDIRETEIRRSDASARPAWPPRTPGGPLGNRPRVLSRAGQPFNPDAPIRLANGRTDLRTQLDARNRADRATFICHKRRCGKAYPARWEKLDAAFRRALAEGRDRVCLPSDLRNGWPAGGPTRRRS